MHSVPIQLAPPGGVELLVLLVVFALIGVLVGTWIYRDATDRGSAWAWQWAVGILLLFVVGLVPGVVGVVAYLLVRGDRSEPFA